MKLRSSLAHFPKRIGFISTRFHGTDGVTLEAAKWADILEEEGADCFWMAGLLDKRDAISHLDPLAFFIQLGLPPLKLVLDAVERVRARLLAHHVMRFGVDR